MKITGHLKVHRLEIENAEPLTRGLPALWEILHIDLLDTDSGRIYSFYQNNPPEILVTTLIQAFKSNSTIQEIEF